MNLLFAKEYIYDDIKKRKYIYDMSIIKKEKEKKKEEKKKESTYIYTQSCEKISRPHFSFFFTIYIVNPYNFLKLQLTFHNKHIGIYICK